MGKSFTKYTVNRGLVSRIYKEDIKIKRNQIIKIWGVEINRFLKRWNASDWLTVKSVQYLKPSRNCKLNLFWGFIHCSQNTKD